MDDHKQAPVVANTDMKSESTLITVKNTKTHFNSVWLIPYCQVHRYRLTGRHLHCITIESCHSFILEFLTQVKFPDMLKYPPGLGNSLSVAPS